MATFRDVADGLKILLEEQGTPKNVRENVQSMLTIINSEGDPHIKADKLLVTLEELQSDVNIPTYVRTQIWSISSMLEDLDA